MATRIALATNNSNEHDRRHRILLAHLSIWLDGWRARTDTVTQGRFDRVTISYCGRRALLHTFCISLDLVRQAAAIAFIQQRKRSVCTERAESIETHLHVVFPPVSARRTSRQPIIALPRPVHIAGTFDKLRQPSLGPYILNIWCSCWHARKGRVRE